LPEEFSHSLALMGIKLITSLGFKIGQATYGKNKDLSGFTVKNSLGLAAGLDKNGDYIDNFAKLGFGFLEIGTVTPRPQPGNKKPRLFRLKNSKAIVNRMGFNNKGVDYLIKKLQQRKSDVPLGISIGKNFDTPNDLAYKDYLFCLERVYEFSDYVAVNISSPNTRNLRELEAEKELNSLISKLKSRQIELTKVFGYRPLFVKISPDNDKRTLELICRTLIDNSVDGLICSNTTIKHDYYSGKGGLSGKPLMDSSTEALKLSRKFLGKDFPIIACGGVMSYEDYDKKIESGADLVQIYTGFIYQGPQLINDIINK
tara:strand:- start:339 stop:1283 length:945 start_codon:yes stop_codon:yes gene_type:complete